MQNLIKNIPISTIIIKINHAMRYNNIIRNNILRAADSSVLLDHDRQKESRKLVDVFYCRCCIMYVTCSEKRDHLG